ncbi:MAG TPA: polyhydroxyalkanoate depolymerase [Myxococcales bacterium]|nr:polyhydroxyalkanoate depolymerase [Myxococcales bacterium]
MGNVNGVYNSYRLSRAWAAPVNSWAGMVQSFWSHPSFPISRTPLGRAVASASELLERATRHYPKPPFGLATTEIGNRTVAVREVPVLATPFCNLIRFERDAARHDPKVLVVAPLSGHHASLLRDTVSRLLPEHDVYLTDWIDARLIPLAAGRFDLDDYIELTQRFIRTLGPDVHVLAVCQPSVPVLAAVSLMAEANDPATPRSMTLMAGPVDTRVNPTQVDRLATTHSLEWFELSAVHRVPPGDPGFLRRVYPGFLQLTAFVSLNPARHADAHRQLYRDLLAGDEESADVCRRFYDDYLAVMDVPAEYYLQTIATVFQEHDLARGVMTSRGKPVRPAAIRDTALMTVEGENDEITSVGQTSAAHDLCSSIPAERRVAYCQAGAGHYGVFSGRRWREEIAPRFARFIRSA